MYTEVREQLRVLSSHHLGTEDWTQAIVRLGGKHLSLLSHLAAPKETEKFQETTYVIFGPRILCLSSQVKSLIKESKTCLNRKIFINDGLNTDLKQQFHSTILGCSTQDISCHLSQGYAAVVFFGVDREERTPVSSPQGAKLSLYVCILAYKQSHTPLKYIARQWWVRVAMCL